MFGGRKGPVLVHRVFCEQFPGLAAQPVRLRPYDYDDPDDFGGYHPLLGAPVLQGYSPATAARSIEGRRGRRTTGRLTAQEVHGGGDSDRA